MEDAVNKSPVMLYTEQTPNPESLKFVTNRMLYKGLADFREEANVQDWSPLATALFDFPFVRGVYISNNYVTISKEYNYSWSDIMLELRDFIKNYVEEGKSIVKEGYAEAMKAIEKEKIEAGYSEEDAEVAQKVIELIDTYVKPSVEMDGGNIEFRSYNDGVVNVALQGSCSGCPSATVTLKSGIEAMLQRMVPQVKEVVSVME
ncbi:MAG: NifU family protein [Bacteroidetes bacterium]|nr:NifU family protein [Bacteroidota bacterium]